MAATLQVLEDEEWEVFAVPAGGMFLWARPGRGQSSRLQALCPAAWGVVVARGAVQSRRRTQ